MQSCMLSKHERFWRDAATQGMCCVHCRSARSPIARCMSPWLRPLHRLTFRRFMDPLAGDSDSESPSGSDSDSGSGQEAKRRKPAAAEKAPPPPVDLESLTHGSSVLFVPEPKPTGEQAWDWCAFNHCLGCSVSRWRRVK